MGRHVGQLKFMRQQQHGPQRAARSFYITESFGKTWMTCRFQKTHSTGAITDSLRILPISLSLYRCAPPSSLATSTIRSFTSLRN